MFICVVCVMVYGCVIAERVAGVKGLRDEVGAV